MPTARGWNPPDGVKSVGVNLDALLGRDVDRSSIKQEPTKKKLERSSTDIRFIEPKIVVSAERIEIALGVRLESRANVNKHWSHTYKTKKDVNEALKLMLALVANDVRQAMATGCKVTMVRVAPRRLDKDDNLPMAFKGIKDTLAQWLFGGQVGRNDERQEVSWVYEQANEGVKIYGVRVVCEVETLP